MVLALVGAGCADLALKPPRLPSFLVVAPADTLVRVGDTTRYEVTVLDQDSVPMSTVPSWVRPLWTTPDPHAVYLREDGRAEAARHIETEVRASFAGLTARSRIRINPRVLVLTAPAFTVTQGVQNADHGVPLIAGREALLRVFVTGDLPSYYQPRVTAHFYRDKHLAHWAEVGLESEMLPTGVSEDRLDLSFNMSIPGGALMPGTELVIEVDRAGVVPHGPGSQLRIPAEGRLALDVRPLRRLDLTVVPVVVASDTAPDQDVHEWTDKLSADSEVLHFPRSVLPIGDLRIDVHEGLVTTADLTTGSGWGELLAEVLLLRAKEGSRGYYYGAVVPAAGSRWRGLGTIGFPVAVGVADAETLAHELGHNMGLKHAPCGGTGGADEDYPYEGGILGVWGYDVPARRLVHPFLYKDVMGYCAPNWVSDYHFVRAMRFREEEEADLAGPPPGGAAGVAAGGEEDRTLLLWGRAGKGEVILDPAFMTDLPATLPEGAGPYRLEGLGSGGRRRVSFRFAPRPTEFGGGAFLFAVPFSPSRDGSLERVVLSGPDGFFTLERSGAPPVAIVTDRRTGRLRGVLRNWSAGRALLGGDTDILVSEGLPH